MKRQNVTPYQFTAISDLHRALGLQKALHPLLSLVDNSQITTVKEMLPTAFSFDFYKISFLRDLRGKIKYGQNYYDFDDGGLVFTSPNQLMSITDDAEYKGYMLLIHPDFIRDYPLGKSISKYGFFGYAANEALHLSEKESIIIGQIFGNIGIELQTNIDDFSQDVIVAQIELLLNYSNRFYKRQFITRKAVNNDLLAKLENILNDYFRNKISLIKGLPTVQYIAAELNVSPHYLSDMLRSLTGQNAQQHIHYTLIEKAKESLATSNLSVAEIAYQLGFEHSQSLHRLFKRKTQLSPLEYRQTLN